ncbi:MAG: cadmium-translocating P-type ATPase [Alphaproteobacteria bacterium]|jgi:Cu2+-exporting ATPase|nr:cadmium-translocating P-type ATPase [Alphaproteobacteria bacterium]
MDDVSTTVPAKGAPAPAGRCITQTAEAMAAGRGMEAAAGGTGPPVPGDDGPAIDYRRFVRTGADGLATLNLLVEGAHCGACVQRIERRLAKFPDVAHGRLNLTTKRLVVRWQGGAERAETFARAVDALGFKAVPFDPERLKAGESREERLLLRAMAVAGFAAGNVMLLSVSIWAGHFQDMTAATRDLLHWFSALIALPAILYAGRPFFRSALAAIRTGNLNMDVPISLAVLLAGGMSLAETMRGAEHAYFDSAITLLFFLLIGRYLDRRARGRARSAAERLVALRADSVTVLAADGTQRVVPPEEVAPGMTVLVAAGERVAVDGRIADGRSDLDTSLITGESVPSAVQPGDPVFAGTLNQSAPLTLTVTAVGEDTLLGEIVRLMELAEQRKARYVALADRVARAYAPVVHLLALATFLGWWLAVGLAWQPALIIAIAVLIITCPCALGLAVPAVQVIASGRLLRQGILLKSATALERLTGVDTVVFDKTGTLTVGRPELVRDAGRDAAALHQAAALAGASRHPLARALVRAVPGVPVARGVREEPGRGLALATDEGEVRLGSRAFCGVPESGEEAGAEMWLARPGQAPVRFAFADPLRADAAQVVRDLQAEGKTVSLLSGDRPATVREAAETLGIDDWQAGMTPADKAARLAEMTGAGRQVLMVGDGLNDAPALAAATVSLSPSTAADISQTAADAIFQGERLAPVLEVLDVARRADALVKQNFVLAFGYNIVTVPLAVLGFVTPLIAALAMSASSIVVVGNALRLARHRSRHGTGEPAPAASAVPAQPGGAPA